MRKVHSCSSSRLLSSVSHLSSVGGGDSTVGQFCRNTSTWTEKQTECSITVETIATGSEHHNSQIIRNRVVIIKAQTDAMRENAFTCYIKESRTKHNLSTMLCVQNPQITRTDLNLMQLIKAGREGAFYKARMLRGTCKGHSLVTCKIAKEGRKMPKPPLFEQALNLLILLFPSRRLHCRWI